MKPRLAKSNTHKSSTTMSDTTTLTQTRIHQTEDQELTIRNTRSVAKGHRGPQRVQELLNGINDEQHTFCIIKANDSADSCCDM